MFEEHVCIAMRSEWEHVCRAIRSQQEHMLCVAIRSQLEALVV